MIQMETVLRVIDNSGGKVAKCIKVYKKRVGLIGDRLLIVVRKSKIKRRDLLLNLKPAVENHVMYKALVIRTKVGLIRKDGQQFKFEKNGVILLTRAQEKLIGTRIFGPILREFRNLKQMKVLALGSRII